MMNLFRIGIEFGLVMVAAMATIYLAVLIVVTITAVCIGAVEWLERRRNRKRGPR